MNSHARLKALQESMAKLFDTQTAPTPEELANWIVELDMALADTALAKASFQAVADVNDSLYLLTRLFGQADTDRISADQVGALIGVFNHRLDTTVREVRPAYL